MILVLPFRVSVVLLEEGLYCLKKGVILRIVERIWFKIKAISLLVINFVILITFTLVDLLMLLGEN